MRVAKTKRHKTGSGVRVLALFETTEQRTCGWRNAAPKNVVRRTSSTDKEKRGPLGVCTSRVSKRIKRGRAEFKRPRAKKEFQVCVKMQVRKGVCGGK